MSDSLAIGKVIRMPCMRRGLCAYPKETILVSQEALTFLAKSAKGIPVVVDHPSEIITDDNVGDIGIVGRVSDFEYDPSDDTWYAIFIVDKNEAIDLLHKGWGVSTAWFGDKYTNGGTYNNVAYDRSLSEGRYEHLAIVQKPRYEMAINPIFLNSNTCQDNIDKSTIHNISVKNSIDELKGQSMIGKLFKKLVTREELKTNEGEELFVNIEGSDIPLSQVISEMAEIKRNKKDEEEEHDIEIKLKEKEKEQSKKMANESDEVDVDGEKMTVAELKNAYKQNKASSKKNMTEEKKEEPKEKDKSENSLTEEEKSKRQENFEMIKTAHENGITYKLEENFTSTKERMEIGKQKYGSK